MSLPLALVLVFAVPASNPVKNAHPHGYARVVKLAPECSAPRADVDLGSCMTAASMLEQDPKTATEVFIAAWERTAFGRPARKFNAPVWVTEANLDKKTGRLHAPEDPVPPDKVVPAKVAAFQRVCVKALREVYRLAGGDYAKAMEKVVGAVTIKDGKSLARFSSKHLAAAGEPAPESSSSSAFGDAALSDGAPAKQASPPDSYSQDIWSHVPSPTPTAAENWDYTSEPAPAPLRKAEAEAAKARPSPTPTPDDLWRPVEEPAAAPAAKAEKPKPTPTPRAKKAASGDPELDKLLK